MRSIEILLFIIAWDVSDKEKMRVVKKTYQDFKTL